MDGAWVPGSPIKNPRFVPSLRGGSVSFCAEGGSCRKNAQKPSSRTAPMPMKRGEDGVLWIRTDRSWAMEARRSVYLVRLEK